ncbi:MAG: ABC transporter substrate-binding protein [Kouleothrix sp.]|nr:ABC transporter substrate-binding protein [Kouleothrix sp.]
MARFVSPARLLALFAALCVLLAACGGAAPAAQPTAASAEQPTAAPAEQPTAAPAEQPTAAPTGGTTASPQETLVFAADLSDQISLDPAVAYEFGGILVEGQIYETLVTFTPGEDGVKPLLAKKWDVKDSGDTWTVTFTLDEKAKFASGKPVTADDVVYSWGRALDLDKSPAFLLKDVSQLKKDSFKAVDAQTFEVTLPKAVSPQVFLSVITFTIAGVVEKAAVEPNAGSDFGSTWLNDHSAGSGPYQLESWERGSQNVIVASPNYWGSAPALKRIIFRNITEGSNLLSAIQTGDADIVQDLGPEQAQSLEGSADVDLVKANSTLAIYMGMNAKVAPLDNADVREAIRYAINYDEIVNNLLNGNGKLLQEIIPDGFLGHTGESPFKQDIAKAKELIAKAGVKDGTEIELLVTAGANAPGGVPWETLAAKIQSDLALIGLKVNIKAIQQSELLNIYRAQKGQMTLILWGPDFPDPDGNVTPFTSYDAKSIAYRNGWEAPDIAKLAAQAASEQDTAKRTELYKQLTERVLHEGPYAMLYQPVRTYGVRKNIKGFTYDAADTPNISLWLISKS